MDSFGILIYPSIRAKMYLEGLLKAKCVPSYILVMDNKHDLFRKIKNICKKDGLNFDVINSSDINDPKIKKALKKRSEKYFVFTGGGILDKETVSMKKFIHCHPGIIPKYKGSTCIYYCILNNDRCGATAFIMSPKIDSGRIIAKKFFEKPKNRDIDYFYDQFIRTELLVEVMKNRKYLKSTQQKKRGKDYYVIHPVLKHIALLSIRP